MQKALTRSITRKLSPMRSGVNTEGNNGSKASLVSHLHLFPCHPRQAAQAAQQPGAKPAARMRGRATVILAGCWAPCVQAVRAAAPPVPRLQPLPLLLLLPRAQRIHVEAAAPPPP